MAKNQIVTDYDDAGFPSIAAVAVPLTATGVVKSGPGRLLKISVTTALSAAAITIYDNASAAAGTVLFVIPASAAAGSVYDVNLPAVNGIYASFGGTGSVTFGVG